MKSEIRIPAILQLLIGLAALTLIFLGIQAAADIVNTIFLAIVFAIVFAPLLPWLVSKGAPNWLAFVIVIAIIGASIGGLILLIAVAGSRFISALPTYRDAYEQQTSELSAWLQGYGIDLSASILSSIFDPTKLINTIVNLFSSIGNVFVSVVFMVIVLAYMLLEANRFPRKLRKEYGHHLTFMANLDRFNYDVRRFMIINTAMGALIGILDVILFLILGVPFPILWGVISFLFNYIPTIGFWLALIPPFILTWLSVGPEAALIVFLGYWFINGGIQNFVQPKVMGDGVDLSPLVVFVSFLIWASVLGPVGAIMAVPLTLFVKDLILSNTEETRGLAFLFGASQAEESPSSKETATKHPS